MTQTTEIIGLMQNTEDLAWLAGFFEGEGSCGCYERKQYNPTNVSLSYNFRVVVSQNEPKALIWGRNLLDLGTICQRTRNGSLGKTPMWVWTMSGNEALKFIELIYPYLKTDKKKQQIDNALNTRRRLRKHAGEYSASKVQCK